MTTDDMIRVTARSVRDMFHTGDIRHRGVMLLLLSLITTSSLLSHHSLVSLVLPQCGLVSLAHFPSSFLPHSLSLGLSQLKVMRRVQVCSLEAGGGAASTPGGPAQHFARPAWSLSPASGFYLTQSRPTPAPPTPASDENISVCKR